MKFEIVKFTSLYPKMMRTALMLLLIVSGFSCTNHIEKDQTKSNADELHVFFSSLIGTWVMDEHPVIEKWETDGSLFRSTVYTVRGSDTVISEEIRITEKEGQYFFEARVRGQNQNKPVLFRLTRLKGNKIIFENPGHDFPQQIIYETEGRENLTATIQGRENSKLKSIKFKYSKIRRV